MPGAGEWEEGGSQCLMGLGFQFCKMKKFWRWMGMRVALCECT